MRSNRQRVENPLDEATRFLQLIEANCDTRGYVPFAANDFLYGQLCIRFTWQIAAKIERLAARATGKSGEPETSGQFRSYHAGAVKSIADTLMLLIDHAQRQHFVCDFAQLPAKQRDAHWGEIEPR